jgi:hypothetical protein
MSEHEKRQWVDEWEEWLRQHDYEVTHRHTEWLEHYYDEHPEEWKQRQRDERENQELLRQIRESSEDPRAGALVGWLANLRH